MLSAWENPEHMQHGIYPWAWTLVRCCLCLSNIRGRNWEVNLTFKWVLPLPSAEKSEGMGAMCRHGVMFDTINMIDGDFANSRCVCEWLWMIMCVCQCCNMASLMHGATWLIPQLAMKGVAPRFRSTLSRSTIEILIGSLIEKYILSCLKLSKMSSDKF